MAAEGMCLGALLPWLLARVPSMLLCLVPFGGDPSAVAAAAVLPVAILYMLFRPLAERVEGRCQHRH